MIRVLLMVSALGFLATSTGSLTVQPATEGDEQVIDIVAERFSFTPSEVTTTVGRKVTVRLTSDDTAHGFRIVGTNVNVEIPKRSRGSITVTFTPEKAGRYTFECSRLCGAGHPFMRGVIVAVDAASEDER